MAPLRTKIIVKIRVNNWSSAKQLHIHNPLKKANATLKKPPYSSLVWLGLHTTSIAQTAGGTLKISKKTDVKNWLSKVSEILEISYLK